MTDSEPEPTSRRFRPLAIGMAVLVPLIPIVIALTLGAGGSATAVTTVTTPAHYTPVPAAPQPKPKPPRASLLLPTGRGALVAAVEHPTEMRSTPGGRGFAKLGTKTTFGSPTTVWVARLSGRWLGVITPQAGNNHVGWIPASDASLRRVQWELKLSLAARRLEAKLGGAGKLAVQQGGLQ